MYIYIYNVYFCSLHRTLAALARRGTALSYMCVFMFYLFICASLYLYRSIYIRVYLQYVCPV